MSDDSFDASALGWVNLALPEGLRIKNQVLFFDILEAYSSEENITISFMLLNDTIPHSDDFIGIYKVEFKDLSSSLLKVAVDPSAMSVTFAAAELPKDDEANFLFLYVRENKIFGATPPFKIRPPPTDVVSDAESEEFLVVHSQLQEENSKLKIELDHSLATLQQEKDALIAFQRLVPIRFKTLGEQETKKGAPEVKELNESIELSNDKTMVNENLNVLPESMPEDKHEAEIKNPEVPTDGSKMQEEYARSKPCYGITKDLEKLLRITINSTYEELNKRGIKINKPGQNEEAVKSCSDKTMFNKNVPFESMQEVEHEAEMKVETSKIPSEMHTLKKELEDAFKEKTVLANRLYESEKVNQALRETLKHERLSHTYIVGKLSEKARVLDTENIIFRKKFNVFAEEAGEHELKLKVYMEELVAFAAKSDKLQKELEEATKEKSVLANQLSESKKENDEMNQKMIAEKTAKDQECEALKLKNERLEKFLTEEYENIHKLLSDAKKHLRMAEVKIQELALENADLTSQLKSDEVKIQELTLENSDLTSQLKSKMNETSNADQKDCLLEGSEIFQKQYQKKTNEFRKADEFQGKPSEATFNHQPYPQTLKSTVTASPVYVSEDERADVPLAERFLAKVKKAYEQLVKLAENDFDTGERVDKVLPHIPVEDRPPSDCVYEALPCSQSIISSKLHSVVYDNLPFQGISDSATSLFYVISLAGLFQAIDYEDLPPQLRIGFFICDQLVQQAEKPKNCCLPRLSDFMQCQNCSSKADYPICVASRAGYFVGVELEDLSVKVREVISKSTAMHKDSVEDKAASLAPTLYVYKPAFPYVNLKKNIEDQMLRYFELSPPKVPFVNAKPESQSIYPKLSECLLEEKEPSSEKENKAAGPSSEKFTASLFPNHPEMRKGFLDYLSSGAADSPPVVDAKNHGKSEDDCHLAICPTCNLEMYICGNDLATVMDHMEKTHKQTLCPICGNVYSLDEESAKLFKAHVGAHFD